MCPEPLRKAEVFFRSLPPGTEVTVLATDAAAPIDFEVWCLQKNHRYLACSDQGPHLEIRLVKGDS